MEYLVVPEYEREGIWALEPEDDAAYEVEEGAEDDECRVDEAACEYDAIEGNDDEAVRDVDAEVEDVVEFVHNKDFEDSDGRDCPWESDKKLCDWEDGEVNDVHNDWGLGATDEDEDTHVVNVLHDSSHPRGPCLDVVGRANAELKKLAD